MDTLFSVSLVENNQIKHKLLFSEFYDINQINNSKSIPVIKEYAQLELIFLSSQNFTLEIEGIEEPLTEKYIEDEYGSIHYLPNSDPIPLYNINKQIGEPLIPGYYEIKVSKDNKSYYSWFKIIPKSLTIAEWELMKQQVENTIIGLAKELRKRKINIYDQEDLLHDDQDILIKLNLLLSELSTFSSVLEQITIPPRNKIAKKYLWKENGAKAQIDMVTIKNLGRFPEKKGYTYSPKHFLNYDIPENRWLKFVLNFFDVFVKEAQIYLEKYRVALQKKFDNDKYKNISDVKRKISLEEIDNKLTGLKKLHTIIYKTLNLNWMQEVSTLKHVPMSDNIMHDLRYSSIYRIYLKLMNRKEILELNNEYQYYWKRTDLLYEIWGFIKIIEMLQKIGFKAKDGWIFSKNSLSNSIVPFLEEKTCVTFEKDKTVVNLFYNFPIPKSLKNPTLKNPLFTKSSSNKPDIRLDVIKKEIYLGSLIFDTKYRSFENIWKKKFSEKTKKQLRNYKNTIDSPILLRGSNYPENAISRFRTVTEVWVLFPKSSDSIKENIIYDEEKILFKELSPSVDSDRFAQDLAFAINELESII